MQLMGQLKLDPKYTISIMKWIVATPTQHYCLLDLI